MGQRAILPKTENMLTKKASQIKKDFLKYSHRGYFEEGI